MRERVWKIAAGVVLALAIVALLLSIARLLWGRSCTTHARVRAEVAWMGSKILAYRCDTGVFPESLQALTRDDLPLGPYAKQAQLSDSWGRPFYYQVSEPQQRFAFYSLGYDGLPGGKDQDADIVYEGSLAPLPSQEWLERGQPVQAVDCSAYKLTQAEVSELTRLNAEWKRAEAARASAADASGSCRRGTGHKEPAQQASGPAK
ncbi:type II secretion system protein GspG [Lysobacter enzymogenes]|uniref:type II secretion system protein GspG n=1 Tax=Lysobacter enzymogenes TaxID=69 RepID=UPI001A9584E4|nr:type II secretion system protein GspG [Lysobacter enzymogenes]QQP97990.1 type II secretion system protein GspG [Lysobacter enzymogenes]